MSFTSIVYTRDFLQGAPEKVKQDQIDSIVNTFKNQLYMDAGLGKKSYMYLRAQKPTGLLSCPPIPEITDAELIAGLFARFPGCNIYYEEKWVDSTSDTRTLKKGFVIDWS